MTETVHRGTWTIHDRAERFYRYLPFDPPRPGEAVTVELDYDRTAGVIDLGCFGPDGFRGWSGGARDRFTIAPEWATPGYLPGEADTGQWHVALGLHRIPGELDYEARVRTGPQTAPPLAEPVRRLSRPPQRNLPARPGRRWVAGDFHAHSEHSDGSLSPAALAELAASTGLEVLAVTDHNTVSHHGSLGEVGAAAGLVLVPGQEVTTDHGHANAFGDIGWIDFRGTADEWSTEVARRGGLLSVNHPIATDCAWRKPLAARPPLAEVWHCTWRDRSWGGPLAWWLAWGTGTVGIGGSDFHSPGRDRPLGEPTTWLDVPDGEVTTGSVLDALRAGAVSIGVSPRGPVLLRVDDEFVAVDADGAALTGFGRPRRIVRGDLARFPAAEGPHWLEADDNTVLSITN